MDLLACGLTLPAWQLAEVTDDLVFSGFSAALRFLMSCTLIFRSKTRTFCAFEDVFMHLTVVSFE